MENKHVGYLLIGISILVIIIVLMFNSTLKEIVTSSCTLAHGDSTSCPMYETINKQTYIALGVIGLLIIVSLVLIFSKPDEKIVIKKIKEKQIKKSIDKSKLEKDEKEVINFLINEGNAVFQKDLMEKLEIGKVKMTRLLDKLEAKQFIIRKRRGMNNIVVLKE
ncbi:MAG: hypothetical protein NUV46_04100 [Nanoarchaeota archaeon]|nr:hypothetical protein [Nanoarchaeota archaeon]